MSAIYLPVWEIVLNCVGPALQALSAWKPFFLYDKYILKTTIFIHVALETLVVPQINDLTMWINVPTGVICITTTKRIAWVTIHISVQFSANWAELGILALHSLFFPTVLANQENITHRHPPIFASWAPAKICIEKERGSSRTGNSWNPLLFHQWEQ